MAAARFIVVLLLLTVFTLTEGVRSFGPKSCCFNFNKKEVPRDRVVGYIRTNQACPNPAVLLKMVTGRRLCVRPSETWVKTLISHLEAKSIPGQMSNL